MSNTNIRPVEREVNVRQLIRVPRKEFFIKGEIHVTIKTALIKRHLLLENVSSVKNVLILTNHAILSLFPI